jgi:uncharacterized repeat protein (TIGR01451 family)
VGGGPAVAGGYLEYVVRVTNIGLVPAANVYITDDLDEPVVGQMNLVPDSITLNGATLGVSYIEPVITADYWSEYGYLEPQQTAVFATGSHVSYRYNRH